MAVLARAMLFTSFKRLERRDFQGKIKIRLALRPENPYRIGSELTSTGVIGRLPRSAGFGLVARRKLLLARNAPESHQLDAPHQLHLHRLRECSGERPEPHHLPPG